MTQDTYHPMLTETEYTALLRKAQQMRADAIRATISTAAKALAGGARATASWLALAAQGLLEGYRAQQVYLELSRMSDSELARLGLTRGDIGAFAAGNHPRRAEIPAMPAASANVTPLKPVAAPAAPQERKAA